MAQSQHNFGTPAKACVPFSKTFNSNEFTITGGASTNGFLILTGGSQQTGLATYDYEVPVEHRSTKHTLNWEMHQNATGGAVTHIKVSVVQAGVAIAERDDYSDNTTQELSLTFEPTADVQIRIEDISAGGEGSNRDTRIGPVVLDGTCEQFKPICKNFDAELPLVEYNTPSPTESIEVGSLGSAQAWSIPNENNIPVGESRTVILPMNGPDDTTIEVELTMTKRAGNNNTSSFGATGGMGYAGNGTNSNTIYEMNVLTCDKVGKPIPISFGLRVSSVQSPGEAFWANGNAGAIPTLDLSDVDLFLAPNGTPITFPASGVFETGVNDQAARFVGFQNRTQVRFVMQGSANQGMGASFHIWEGPEIQEQTHCETLGDVAKELNATNQRIDDIQSPNDPQSEELGNLIIEGDDGEEYAMPLKETKCYTGDFSSAVATTDPGFDTVPNQGSIPASDWDDVGFGLNMSYPGPGLALGTGGSGAAPREGLGQDLQTQDCVEYAVEVVHRNGLGASNITVEVVDGGTVIHTFQTTQNTISDTQDRTENFSFVGNGNAVIVQFYNDGNGGHVIRSLAVTPVEGYKKRVSIYSDGETEKMVYFDGAGDPQEITQAEIDSLTLTPCEEDDSCKNCYEYPLVERVFTMPGEMTLERGYTVTVTRDDNTTENTTLPADASLAAQATAVAAYINGLANIDGTVTAVGNTVVQSDTLNIASIDFAVVPLTLGFNDNEGPVESIPDKAWDRTDGSTTVRVEFGTAQPLSGPTSGNGIVMRNQLSTDINNVSVTAGTQPTNIRVRLNDLDFGAGVEEHVNVSPLPTSINAVNGSAVLNGSVIEATVGNTDVDVFIAGNTLDFNTVADMAPNRGIGVREVELNWDYASASSSTGGTLLKAYECGGEWTDENGATITEPAGALPCGVSGPIDSLQTQIDNISIVSPMAAYDVTGNGNGNNTVLSLTTVREDAGWLAGAYAGTPDRVRITTTVNYDIPQNGAAQRVSPILELLKGGTVVAISSTGYQRHATDHNESSNTITFTDPTPGANPVYSLRARRGSSQTDVVNVSLGSIQLEAIL